MTDYKATEAKRPPFRWVWPVAVAVFVLAGVSGGLFRMWMVNGFPAGLLPENVRHAHSHLMYFGWVTPLLMALIAASIPALTRRSMKRYFRIRINIILAATFVLALMSFVPFLLYGYTLAEIGGKRIPISMIIAGLNVIPWYFFAAVYRRMTRAVERTHALRLTDASVLFLVLSSLGAWGLAAMRIAKVSHPFWDAVMLHAFLDLFAGGWLVLGLLGVAYTLVPYRRDYAAWAGTALACTGLPLAFMLMIPSHITPSPVRLMASVGGAMFAVGLLLHVANIWPKHQIAGAIGSWWVPLALLGMVAATMLAVSSPPVAVWAEGMHLRILFLHVLLLGFVSLALLTGVRWIWEGGRLPGYGAMAASVVLMLFTLVPLTGPWPAAWFGQWALVSAGHAAFLPVAGALVILAAAGIRRLLANRTGRQRAETFDLPIRSREHSAVV